LPELVANLHEGYDYMAVDEPLRIGDVTERSTMYKWSVNSDDDHSIPVLEAPRPPHITAKT
jgi:hypothetical protein